MSEYVVLDKDYLDEQLRTLVKLLEARYLSKIDASKTYATTSQLDSYVTKKVADNTYISKTDGENILMTS